jgi:predicted NACHT family NTPase
MDQDQAHKASGYYPLRERVLEFPDGTRRLLPLDKPIDEFFDEVGPAVLILGDLSSGKTATLLELAHKLIHGADDDPSQRVSVVLKHSTWADAHQSLLDWVVGASTAKYYIPKRINRHWLKQSRLLLLLDVLDKV